MPGAQPVVLAASWIVRASIRDQRSNTLTRSCQGWRGRKAVPGELLRLRLSRGGELLLGLGDPALALGTVRVGHGLAGEGAALAGAGETEERAHQWHGHVIPDGA